MFLLNRIIAMRRQAKSDAEGKNDTKKTRKQSKIRRTENPDIKEIRTRFARLESRALSETWKKMQGSSRLRHVNQQLHKLFLEIFADKEIRKMLLCVAFERGSKKRAVKHITSAHDHARFLACALEHIIDPAATDYSKHCHTFSPTFIGMCHGDLGPLGFKSEFWEIFGEKLAAQMVRQDPIRFYPYGMKAWSLLSAIFTDRMRAGYEKYDISKMEPSVVLPPYAYRKNSAKSASSKVHRTQSNETEAENHHGLTRSWTESLEPLVCKVRPECRYPSPIEETRPLVERRRYSAPNLTVLDPYELFAWREAKDNVAQVKSPRSLKREEKWSILIYCFFTIFSAVIGYYSVRYFISMAN